MMKSVIRVPIIAVTALIVSSLGTARAAIPWFFDQLNQASDNAGGYLINADGGADTTIDVGDRLRGFFRIETIEDLSGGGGRVDLLSPGQATEFTAIYDITALAKVPNPAGGAQIVFGPTPNPDLGPGPVPAVGTMIRFFEDPAKNYTRLLGGLSDDGDAALTGADLGQGPFATEEAVGGTATDGAPYWDLGFTGPGGTPAVPGEGWVYDGSDDMLQIRNTAPPGNLARNNFALNLTANFLGPVLGPVGSSFGGTVDINGSFVLLGVIGAQTPFDHFGNVDFALRPETPQLAALGDRVWLDRNGDGIQNCSTPTGDVIGDGDDGCTEPGIAGVEVQLLDPGADGVCGTGDEGLLALTATDADGFYLFSGLTPGQYCVAVVKPAGFVCTENNQGADDALDSDVVDQGNGTCQSDDPVQNPIDLAAGETDLTWDAGLYEPARLGDFVWNDLDRDGIQDAGEPGIPGVEVRLLQCVGGVPGPQVATEVTDADGLYLFDGLRPGDYAVAFVAPAGFQFSPANQGADDTVDSDAENIVGSVGETACVNLESGETDLTVDGGLFAAAGLGDRVWEDLDADGIQDSGEPGIPGVTVNLLLPGVDGVCDTGDEVLDSTTTTNATGMYAFNDLNPGRYCVEFVKPDICDPIIGGASSFSPADQGADDTLDSDANPATGQTGNIDLDPNEFDPTNDAGVYCPAKIGDFVWNDVDEDGIQDAGEPGISGVTVNLLDCGADGVLGTADDGGQVGTTTTDAGGMYMFNPLAPGNYAVEFVAPAGFVFSPQDQGADDTLDSDADPTTGQTVCTNLSSNEYDDTWDAGLFEPQEPGIDIEKLTNGIDADDPNAGDAPQIAIGDTVTWSYVVANTGNTTLFNVTVVDDQGVTVMCPQDTLAPGETMTCTATGVAEDLTMTTFTTVPGLCGGFPNTPLYENRGTATGETVTGQIVQDEDPSHYCNPQERPAIDIEKATNGVDADDPNAGDAPQVFPGDTVTWTYVVTNTGNVALMNVTVVDNQGVTVMCPQDTLAPGETMTCTANGVAEDLTMTAFTTVPGLCGGFPNTPLYENRGTATGETASGQFVQDEDPSHYCNPQEQVGTGTPGYWKNHPEAWPVDEITIGGVTYTKDEAIEIMKIKLKDDKEDGDKTITMFQALVAAKLNVLIGTDASCIADTIAAADAWMATFGPVGSDVNAGGDDSPWRIGEPLYFLLDDYNNGLLCAPSRDALE